MQRFQKIFIIFSPFTAVLFLRRWKGRRKSRKITKSEKNGYPVDHSRDPLYAGRRRRLHPADIAGAVITTAITKPTFASLF